MDVLKKLILRQTSIIPIYWSTSITHLFSIHERWMYSPKWIGYLYFVTGPDVTAVQIDWSVLMTIINNILPAVETRWRNMAGAPDSCFSGRLNGGVDGYFQRVDDGMLAETNQYPAGRYDSVLTIIRIPVIRCVLYSN